MVNAKITVPASSGGIILGNKSSIQTIVERRIYFCSLHYFVAFAFNISKLHSYYISLSLYLHLSLSLSLSVPLSLSHTLAHKLSGRGGATIRSIADESGAKISMTSKDESIFTQERILSISGSKISCIKCLTMVN